MLASIAIPRNMSHKETEHKWTPNFDFWPTFLGNLIMPFSSAGSVSEESVVEEGEKCGMDNDISKATTTAIDTKVSTLNQRLNVTDSVGVKKQEKKIEAAPSNVSAPAKPSIDHNSGRIPLAQLFLPKIRLVTVLLLVDPIAAWVVAFSIISRGLAKTWSLAFKVQAMTVFQEAILSRSIETTVMAPILLRQLALEVLLQIAIYAGHYGHKRYKKKMKKHLTQQLFRAYASLPYEIQIDPYTRRKYSSVCSLFL
jgi:hypothetical protein